MTTNDSTINAPQPIDPPSQIALAVLAKFFDDRNEQRSSLAEQCRDDDPSMYPEQKAIADTWLNAARITWDLLGGRPDRDKYVRRVHTVEMDLRELGKLIAMATTPQESPANECANSERTQYELTIEQQKAKIAELAAEVTRLGSWDRYENIVSRRVDELQARIDELTKLPVVDGAAVLQRVRERIASVERMSTDTDYGKQWAHVDAILEIIDDELAALTPAKSPTTP